MVKVTLIKALRQGGRVWERRALQTGKSKSRGWEAFVWMDLREDQGH